jgi:hypothetical protein
LQTNEVKYIRLEGGEMDHEVIRTQNKKVQVNEELMRPLLRRHDEGPLIMDLLTFGGFLPMDFGDP